MQKQKRYKCSVTPIWIDSVKENNVYVFSTDREGSHTSGSAKKALELGAKIGTSFGLSVKTFAIPTKCKDGLFLPTEIIKTYVEGFVLFAKKNPQLHFLVTEIGCGGGPFRHEAMAPLFKEAIEVSNISLPSKFIEIILATK